MIFNCIWNVDAICLILLLLFLKYFRSFRILCTFPYVSFFVNFFEYSNFLHFTWLYNSQIHIGDTYIDMTSTSITFYIGTFTEIYGEIQMSRMSTYTITNVLFKVNPNRARINHISVYLQNEANQPYFFFEKKNYYYSNCASLWHRCVCIFTL